MMELFPMKLLKLSTVLLCATLTACGSVNTKTKEQPAKMPPAAVTQAWLDEYEPQLKEALKDSKFELERRENVLLVTAPVDSTFNPDRPSMLMPTALGPISRMAKLTEHDSKVAILILGHADSSGSLERNRTISIERAAAVTAIFRLSGFKNERLMRKGVGPDMPRAANDSAEGRALNRRVEILVTRQDIMSAMLAQYSQSATAPQVASLAPSTDAKSSKVALAEASTKAPAKAKAPVKAKAKAAPAKSKAVASSKAR
jgi:outer membrane protein OmpA-like peptidoglycan-associated protein